MRESMDQGVIYPSVKVAAVFAAPVMLDRDATVAKACALIDEAADAGAEFVVFPESFVPGFPIWTAYTAPIDGQGMFERFARNALTIDGPEMRMIRERAARRRIFAYLGFCEAASENAGCLWNSAALIGDDGEILNHHRKLVPTFYEKLVWAPGDGAGLRVSPTRIGRIGGLICGENNNMLARYALAAEGEQIHAAAFPSVWPFRNPLNTAGNFDIGEAIRIRIAAHCFEAKAFAVVSAALFDDATLAVLAETAPAAADVLAACPKARSMIVGPDGDLLAQSGDDREEIIVAEIDLGEILARKQHHDIGGYYNRFDVFKLDVDRTRLTPFRDTSRDRPGPRAAARPGDEGAVERFLE